MRRSRVIADCVPHAHRGPMPEHLTVVAHPLVQHKLTIMRERDTSTASFRRLLREISLLLAYEVTRDLPMTTKTIETPLTEMEAPVLKGKARAHLDPARRQRPARRRARADPLGPGRLHRPLPRRGDAPAGAILLQGPADLAERVTIAVDPMLATGNSSAAAVPC